jgi:hypothetical protein
VAALWILVSSLVPLPSFYGAIAYDRQGGAYGFAYDQPSPVVAGRRALDRCGSPGCALVLEFADGCGAYATGPNAAAGAGSDYTRTMAEDRALAQCRSAGGNCQVKVWACNSTPGTEPPATPGAALRRSLLRAGAEIARAARGDTHPPSAPTLQSLPPVIQCLPPVIQSL